MDSKAFLKMLSSEEDATKMVKVEVGSGCDTRAFYINARVLCQQSPFFKAALAWESGGARMAQVSLPDDDPTTFGYLLFFLHRGELQSVMGKLGITAAMKAMVLADKLSLDPNPASHLSDIICSNLKFPKGIPGQLSVSEILKLACDIPSAGPIIDMIAEQQVKEYITSVDDCQKRFPFSPSCKTTLIHESRFWLLQEMQDHPYFGMALLANVAKAFRDVATKITPHSKAHEFLCKDERMKSSFWDPYGDSLWVQSDYENWEEYDNRM